MYDKELIRDILYQISEATRKISQRFEQIETASDFTNLSCCMEKPDSICICMLLIAIGESLKKIDKITAGQLLEQYSEIDWNGAKGLKDIIAHQYVDHRYFDIDAEEIFRVCANHIPPLSETIEKMLSNLAV